MGLLETERHVPPSDEMHVKVENSLAGVRTGVDYETVPPVLETVFFGQATANRRQSPEHRFMFRFDLVERLNVFVWYQEDMDRSHGPVVPKSGDPFILINDLRFGIPGGNFTKRTILFAHHGYSIDK
jgi:hypothetical protein